MCEIIEYQTTIRTAARLSGPGVHSGEPSRIGILPAPADHGIAFSRGGHAPVPARSGHVRQTELCTVIGAEGPASVSTIEHLMAALSGLGVDNALVEIDGPEVPILDGSALPFVEAGGPAGLETLDAPRRRIRVLRTVEVERNGAYARLDPAPRGFHLDIGIDFANPAIGRQEIALSLTPESFRREIAFARTFGFLKDVESLWRMGYALGSSFENTVVIAGEEVATPGGLRDPREFVRHKALDAIGDLALSGLPLVGAYRSRRGGHALNAAILDALFSDAANYDIIGDARRIAWTRTASTRRASART
jgi:UDP-3-O-[3-hydroxymyristoyl] N-acetylglucosamine deacetylase